MKKNTMINKLFAIILLVCISFTPIIANAEVTQSISNNKKLLTLTMEVGDTYNLSIAGKDSSKNKKFQISNKKVVTVSKSGKVKAKKPGKATINVKVGKTKLKCKITVLKKFSKKNITVTYEPYKNGIITHFNNGNDYSADFGMCEMRFYDADGIMIGTSSMEESRYTIGANKDGVVDFSAPEEESYATYELLLNATKDTMSSGLSTSDFTINCTQSDTRMSIRIKNKNKKSGFTGANILIVYYDLQGNIIESFKDEIAGTLSGDAGVLTVKLPYDYDTEKAIPCTYKIYLNS